MKSKRSILIGTRMTSTHRKMISAHFTYNEAIKSKTAKALSIRNDFQSQDQYNNAMELADNILEPVREYFNIPIMITSWLRVKKLNKAIGGSKTSDHITGRAVDIKLTRNRKGATLADVYLYIKNNLEFDQLIWEFGDAYQPAWLHIGFRKGENRNQVLVAYKNIKGKTMYRPVNHTKEK